MPDQKKSRREMLESFVAQKPNDPFSLYALSMECMNTNDTAAADTHFRALLNNHTDYIPAYLMYAQFLARESRAAEARQVLITGIAAATTKHDDHARSEMESLLNDLS